MKSLAKANLQLAQSHRTDPRTSLLSLLSLNRKMPPNSVADTPATIKPTTSENGENAEAAETETESEEESPSDRRVLAATTTLSEEVNTCLFDNCNLKR